MENGNAHDKTGLESKTRQSNGSAADEVPRMEMVTRMGYFRCKTPLPKKPDKECGHHEWKNKRGRCGRSATPNTSSRDTLVA